MYNCICIQLHTQSFVWINAALNQFGDYPKDFLKFVLQNQNTIYGK